MNEFCIFARMQKFPRKTVIAPKSSLQVLPKVQLGTFLDEHPKFENVSPDESLNEWLNLTSQFLSGPILVRSFKDVQKFVGFVVQRFAKWSKNELFQYLFRSIDIEYVFEGLT